MKTTVEIKKMGINGEGIGYINRKIVFIKGALLNMVNIYHREWFQIHPFMVWTGCLL